MRDLVIMGLGQLGQLYGAGALRAGLRVTPLLRGDSPTERLSPLPPGTPLLIAVAESDLEAALASLPRDRVEDAILIQNELFPRTWLAAGLERPSVAVPWVLKKPGLPTTVARPTPLFGRHLETLVAIHTALGLPYERLPDEDALGDALVSKYAFILALNALGVARDVTLGAWLTDTTGTREGVVADALRLGEAKLGRSVDRDVAAAQIAEGMRALASFPARGRTAQARLARALADADALGVPAPALRTIVASARQ